MASSIGGSGSDDGGGDRRSSARVPAGEAVERTEQRAAVKSSRVSAGASQSRVSSSEDNGVRAIFRQRLTKHVMKVSKYYLKHELLTETAHDEVVHQVVENIINHERGQIPPTEKMMEQYISRKGQKIKDLVKKYVEKFW